MNINKLEAYEENLTTYGGKVQYYIEIIEPKVSDPVLLEDIKLLAEACYKEGYKDGYRFSDWLHGNTQK